MKTAYKIIVTGLLLSSCVRHYYNAEGGVRVKNPKVFKYNKPRYTARSKAPVNTHAVYVLDSSYNQYRTPKGTKHTHSLFVRFFSTGQVLFFIDTTRNITQANNPDIGTQGYYIVKGNRIKIDMFQELNGGQTGKKFGWVLNDSTLLFYDQRPETYYGSFTRLQRDPRRSFWKKVVPPHLQQYKPSW